MQLANDSDVRFSDLLFTCLSLTWHRFNEMGNTTQDQAVQKAKGAEEYLHQAAMLGQGKVGSSARPSLPRYRMHLIGWQTLTRCIRLWSSTLSHGVVMPF